MRLISPVVAALAISTTTAPAQQRPAQPSAASQAVEAVAKFMGSPAASPKPRAERVNINRAAVGDIDAVLKLGNAPVRSIIAGRPYVSVQDLLERRIVSPTTYDAIKDRLTVK